MDISKWVSRHINYDIADIGIMNNTSKEAYRLEDFIGFGINVIGTDLEEGCRSFYDYRGIKEVAGIRDNHHLIISFLVNEVTPKEYNAKNINEFEANLIYGDLFTVYGIDVFLKALFTSYYDDIVNYHYEQMLPIPELILKIMHSNYLEYDDQLQDFLLLAKEVFGKYVHEKNFSPESIQLISITCRNDNLELYHRNFSKSLNYIMRELISEAGNYLII